MSTSKISRLAVLGLFFYICTDSSAATAVQTESQPRADSPPRYEIRDQRPKDESIFDVTFGGPPPLATERGILVVDAFNDLNNNLLKEDNEQLLVEEITCRLGEVDYQVPAFIPGLEYNDSYSLSCSGQTYQPTSHQPEVFIEKRGQIIRMMIPCRTHLGPSELLGQ